MWVAAPSGAVITLPPAGLNAEQIDEMHNQHKTSCEACESDKYPRHHTRFKFIVGFSVLMVGENAKGGATREQYQGYVKW